MSADPLAVHSPGEADLNLYAYVHGQVFIAVDPDGLQSVPAPAAGVTPPPPLPPPQAAAFADGKAVGKQYGDLLVQAEMG